MTGPQCQRLPDGRLHLHHGPIDLICEAWGTTEQILRGYDRAALRFGSVLPELVAELSALRSQNAVVSGSVAKRMACAVAPFQPAFITPMAAVAGAVAETILTTLVEPGMPKAYVNNGGDIALHLAPGQSLSAAIGLGPHRIKISAADPIRGMATSGWRGRSFSLGIADCVTVLAQTASMADAAATMIANAVDLPGHAAIERRPAREIQYDSDLGARLVTVSVGQLTQTETAQALERGLARAFIYQQRGLIHAAALVLNADLRTMGAFALKELANA